MGHSQGGRGEQEAADALGAGCDNERVVGGPAPNDTSYLGQVGGPINPSHLRLNEARIPAGASDGLNYLHKSLVPVAALFSVAQGSFQLRRRFGG